MKKGAGGTTLNVVLTTSLLSDEETRKKVADTLFTYFMHGGQMAQITTANLEDLRDAQSRGILAKRLKYYAHSKLLIIDELGYLAIDAEGADLMFQLVSTRYEQRSTIITTNVGIGGWARVFGDDVAASAIADRVCHHCTLIRITGRSYRLKDLPTDRRREG